MYGQSLRISFYLCLVAVFVACASAGKMITLRASKTKDGDRITNGQNATVDQIPYIVQIVDKYAYGDGFICGGSIVSDRFVLSAAHCFRVYNAGDLAVVANVTYMNENRAGIRRDVEALYNHPKYDAITDNNDVAVIKLSEPLTFGPGVQKIEMCPQNWRTKEKIIVAGWGHTAEDAGKYSNQLQMVKLETLSPKECQDFDGITPKMACSVVTKGKDACQGDSGGPAIYNGKLCGIVSFGFGCGRNDAPGVFASIPKLRQFIDKSMAK